MAWLRFQGDLASGRRDKVDCARRDLEGLESVQGGQFSGQAGHVLEGFEGKKIYANVAYFYVEREISWRRILEKKPAQARGCAAGLWGGWSAKRF